MRISVFGLGYVGSVTAVGLAQLGHEIIGVDVVPEKLKSLEAGQAPVKEPQLDSLLQETMKMGRLQFTSCDQEAVLNTDCAMVCVGTPSSANGTVALGAVKRCIQNIAAELASSTKTSYCIIIRSTVPPATTQYMAELARAELSARSSSCQVSFCMHPEFTREGIAVHDFLHPALIVFGEDEVGGIPLLDAIYPDMDVETVRVDTRTAELIKYTNNAFHALKVAFANEIGRVAEAYEVDSHKVMDILCADTKLNISSKYLRPGFAFGGSCLPKDLRGINSIARQRNVNVPLLHSVLPSNGQHIAHFCDRIVASSPGKIGLLGMAFKQDTDDLRESPALRLVLCLLEAGLPLKMADANLETAYLMGRNKAYIDALLPEWEDYYATDIPALFDFADTIIVTNPQSIYQKWVANYGEGKEVVYLY